MKCSGCIIDKSSEEFPWKNKTKGIKSTKCKLCSRQYSKTYYGKNKQYSIDRVADRRAFLQNWITTELKATGCIDCGERDPIVLDFDHVRGEKNFNIAHGPMMGLSKESILEEVAKCELRCANCHRRITHKRKQALVIQQDRNLVFETKS